MPSSPSRRTTWRRRFFLLLAVCIGGVGLSVVLAPKETFLIYYQPFFFLLILGFVGLTAWHDAELLLAPEPLGEPGSTKIPAFLPLSERAVTRLVRGFLVVRIALLGYVLTHVLPVALPAYRRLWDHLV